MKLSTGIFISIATAVILFQTSKDEQSPKSIGTPEGEGNYFKTAAGIFLYLRTWMPAAGVEPKGIIFIIHGFHEHAGRGGYQELVKKFNAEGFIVYGHDHQGHGLSNGEPAFFPSIFTLRDDAIELIEAKSKDADLPVFIWGQSMGGMISELIALKRPTLLSGMVLTDPAIKLDDSKLNFINMNIAPLLSKVLPKVWFPEGVPLEKLTRNIEAQKLYSEDPLCYTDGFVRIRSGGEIMTGSLYAQAHAHEVTTPLLILHGTEDEITDIKGSRDLVEKAASTDKQLIEMKGLFHEVYEDPDRDMYLSQAINWIKTRSSKL